MNKPITAVFDFDGTLVDTYHGVTKALYLLLKDFLGKSYTLEEVKAGYSPDMITVAKNFEIDLSSPKFVEKLMEEWAILCGPEKVDYDIFSGIPDLLDTLKELKCPLHVWTARDRVSTTAILEALGLAHYFVDIRCADDGGMKPDPWGMIDMFGPHDGRDMVMVGDGLPDVVGAANYGIPFIGAVWSEHVDHSPLIEEGAKYLANRPHQVLEFMRTIFG